MTNAYIANPQPLVSTAARAVCAFAVAGVIALVSLGTAEASHTAVDTCAQNFSRISTVQVVQLPKVEIVGHRAV